MNKQQYKEFDYITTGETKGVGFDDINGEEFDFEFAENNGLPNFDSVWNKYLESYHVDNVNCKYCNSKLKTSRLGEEFLGDRNWVELKWCENCKFWMWNSKYNSFENRIYQSSIAEAVARKFQKIIPDGCSKEIAQYIRQNPNFLNQIDPISLEKFVTDVFKANYKHGEVIHVGKPFDQGVDVLYIESDGKEWLIQVKRRSKENSSEGFSTIQSLAGTLLIKNKLNRIVVSTADRFTTMAYKTVNRLQEKQYIIKLIDKGKLNRMLSPLLPTTPWKELIIEDTISFNKSDMIKQRFINAIEYGLL